VSTLDAVVFAWFWHRGGCMGTQPPPDDRLVGFYTREYRESARLQRPSNRLEVFRTRELLRDRLPAPPAGILDVGGGTAVYARWLAADGYDVTLVDVCPPMSARRTSCRPRSRGRSPRAAAMRARSTPRRPVRTPVFSSGPCTTCLSRPTAPRRWPKRSG
jgi:hypothetical protein